METVARYREFAPCEALRPYVRALFHFTIEPARAREPSSRGSIRETLFHQGQPFWSRLFADGHVSLVFSIGAGYGIEGLWHPRSDDPCGHVIGPMAAAHSASHGDRLIQTGAYLLPAGPSRLTGVPPSELADRVVAAADLWGREGRVIEEQILSASTDCVDCLERALLRQLRLARCRESSFDFAGLAASINARRGAVGIRELAEQAGVSRQYLARTFREYVGVAPKLYCRLARFSAVLQLAGHGGKIDWARAAAESGFADQSHMIADFRQFSGVTPEKLADSFHPFLTRPASQDRLRDG